MRLQFRRIKYCTPLMVLLLFVACGGSDEAANDSVTKWSAVDAEREYQMIQAELKLSALEKPYLVLNFDKKMVRLKLKSAVVWEFPINIEQGDSDELQSFIDRFHDGRKLVRPITATHLYSFKEQTPDSILTIISDVTKFDASLLQRELPARFELHWGDAVILDIRTDVEGKQANKLKNTIVSVRHLLQSPLGVSQITIKMDPVHAMTLYRVAHPGLATIVQAPR